ncbi:MAG: hypothetical protein H9917_07190 [Candidatus Oceanisphaera merdipullorum]|nr:hypothetical protein [Candidatus Oceanisphaera merdipullorum]
MQITNFTQLIEWTRQLHQHLANALQQGGELHQQERAQLLLESLAQLEQRLERTIKRFENETNTAALDAYVPYLYSAFEQHPIRTQRIYTEPYQNLSIAQISEVVFDVHDQVIDFYQRLKRESKVPEAQELLGALLELEQEAEKRMASHIDGMQDM